MEGQEKDKVADEVSESFLPASCSAAEMNRRNKAFWDQKGGETFKNTELPNEKAADSK